MLCGVYRVGRVLHQSGTGAIHETEFGDSGERAVIKIRRGDTPEAEELVGRWLKAVDLEHPNLLRVYAAGSATLYDVPVIYAVMERADESLAGVLAERALSEHETREMVVPAIAALRHLHSHGYVHGALKPSNILACGDRLKLSMDGLKEIGGGASPVDDIWGLGEVIVEALTQKRPKIVPELGPYILRENSQAFTDIVRHCLDPDGYRRWNLDQVEARLNEGRPAVFTPPPPAAKPVPVAEPPRAAPAPPAPVQPAAFQPPEKKEEPARVIVLPVREAGARKEAAAPEGKTAGRIPDAGPIAEEDVSERRTPRWIVPGLAAVVLVVALVAFFRMKPSAPVPAAASPTPAFEQGPAPAARQAPASQASGPQASAPAATAQAPAAQAPMPAKKPAPLPPPAPEVKAPVSDKGARRATGWSVIVAAYNARGPAEKRQQKLAKRWTKFNLGIQQQQAGRTVYFVVLGQNLSEAQAQALRKRAISSGLPRDTYIKRIQ